MRILLTGATGFVGSYVTRELQKAGHTVAVVSRSKGDYDWSEESLRKGVQETDAVCHLAGEPIVGRWTASKKEEIRRSRVETTSLLARLLAEKGSGTLVQASAVGFYGDRGDEQLDETSAPGQGFLTDVCQAWEDAAAPAREAGIRVASVRIGVVLGADGGALKLMKLPFQLCLGGPLGSGKQWFPWIHVGDLARLFVHLLETETAEGPYNGTAPVPVTNKDYSKTLGRVLGRPAFLPAPAFAVRLALGEMADMLLGGQRVDPKRTQAEGFTFQFTELEPALRDLLS